MCPTRSQSMRNPKLQRTDLLHISSYFFLFLSLYSLRLWDGLHSSNHVLCGPPESRPTHSDFRAGALHYYMDRSVK